MNFMKEKTQMKIEQKPNVLSKVKIDANIGKAIFV